MRIALLSTPFIPVPPPRYGGTELVVAELAEGLVERGHEVTLFATGDSTACVERRSLYAHAQWPPEMLPDINHISWALHEVAMGDFDVVHANSASALACWRGAQSTPLVYTLHHVRDEALSAFYRFFPDAWYVAISHDQAQREIPLPHVEVIHHGLDPHKYQWTASPCEYVCFVGRFTAVKGPHVAIDVAAAAGVDIRVAGEVHPVDADFGSREMSHRLAASHVTMLGSIGMDDKVPLLRDARALLAPITWDEPFGLALIEAMLSGCPVIAFPRGSVPELVENGVTGYVVRDAAEMRAIVQRGSVLDHFDRERCRARAIERFGRDRMVRDYERVYARTASKGRTGGHPMRAARSIRSRLLPNHHDG
ncbi:MAG: glycosyltransferase family 4 protein [Gemmatimonadaceae bacterium]